MNKIIISISFATIVMTALHFIVKIMIERGSTSVVKKMLKDLDSVEDSTLENEKYGVISISNSGFTFTNQLDKRMIDVKWDDISRIVTYKKDLGVTDLICLGWESLSGEVIEVHEEMVGFRQMSEKMVQTFNGISELWMMEVMQPPFETNFTELWTNKKYS